MNSLEGMLQIVYNKIVMINTERKTLYDLISGCINTFRKIPKLIESYLVNKDLQDLTTIMISANRFVSLSNYIVESLLPTEEYVELFHRFFSRLRELIYSYLGFYVPNNGNGIIRQLLIQINKQLLNYRSDTDPITILKAIHLNVMNSLRNAALTQHQSPQQIQQILKLKLVFMKRPQLIPEQPLYIKNKGLPKNIEDEIELKNLIKSCGIDVISNLDAKHFERLTKEDGDQLQKNLLARNKNVKIQISRYSAGFDLYEQKPLKRRNIASSVKIKPQTTKPTSRSKKKDKKQKLSNNSLSFRKYSSIRSIKEDQSDELIKKQILLELGQKKKRCQPKIIVGNDLSFRPLQQKTMGLESNRFQKKGSGGRAVYQLYASITKHSSITKH